MSVAETLLGLRSHEEVEATLSILFTPLERKEIENRWQGCQMALRKRPQREISSALGMGKTTAARCARVVREAPSPFVHLALRLGLIEPGPNN